MSAAIPLAVVLAAVLAYVRNAFSKRRPTSLAAPAYVLENTVTHARLLPAPATHAFTYPTLAFLLSLDALEAHALDLARGWLFGYGGTAWRLTGLRSGAYLLPDTFPGHGSRSTSGASASKGTLGQWGLKAKLVDVLVMQGKDAARVGEWKEVGDAWMLTMPSYMGFEGINPLTVYFCYSREGVLEWIVLEIHNTFGEKHVHVLEPGVGEDESSSTSGWLSDLRRYEHTWTIHRDFHVSPFNDRSGFYTVSISPPPAPRSPLLASSPPCPKIRIHLRNESPPSDSDASLTPGALRLTALLVARRSAPLTSFNLICKLAKYPFGLFLSFARILYHAWILHYVKRLDVFPLPDPKPSALGWRTLPSGQGNTQQEPERIYGGIGRQPETAIETQSREVVERFLTRRAEELGVTITLLSGDPSVPRWSCSPSSHELETDKPDKDTQDAADLTIHYASPRFFTTLVLAPSAQHMLLLGRTEDLFRVSSESRFLEVFASTSRDKAFGQMTRGLMLPRNFSLALRPSGVEFPPGHPLDAMPPHMNTPVVFTMLLADWLEKKVFKLIRARFVPGLDPWGRFERAAAVARSEQEKAK
ncbi:hypothetical protein C8Q78DRAFT_975614 [Trametes maxima]|nr:hypothetical protein C8Q78DRAFT_975614 [Trametes maxima]